MFEKSLHVVMAICLSLSIALAESPKNHGDGDPFESDAYIFLSGAVPYLSAIAYAPSSPDNWLGGTGNWSNTSFWSSGLPGQSSDVMINTGNDYVTLNTSASINSLTLGGNSGSSTLIDPTGGDYAVNIAGALTINQSGALSLSTGDVVTADANSRNGGSIILNDGAQLQINANFSNLQGMQMDNGTALNVTGTFDNSGSIQYLTDPAQLTINVGAALNNSGTITGGIITVGGNLANTGLLIPAELTVQGALSNPGQLQLTRAVATVGGLDNSGQIVIASGTITDQGNLLNSKFIDVGVANPNSQSYITVGGTLTNTSSALLNMGSSYGLGIILNAGSLVNSGQLQLSGLTQVQINGNVNNSGTLTTTSSGSNAMHVGGQFTNSPSGLFQLAETADTATIANLINQGQIVIGSGATLTVPVSTNAAGNALAGFVNAGNVLIQQGGEISSFGKYTQNTGQTTVDGQLAGIINFNGGSVYGNGGTISGSITSNASINVGDEPLTVGQLTFAGNFIQRANGSLTFDIAGLNQYDQMTITGQAHLNGLMTVDLLHGYIPQIGNLFEIMTFASGSGTFSNVVGLPIDNQEHFVLQYNSTNLTLDVVAGQLSGITSLKLGSGNSISYEPFIQTADSGSGYQIAMNEPPSQTTPEPGTLLLCSSGFVCLVGLRRSCRMSSKPHP